MRDVELAVAWSTAHSVAFIPGTPTLSALTEYFVSKVDPLCHLNFTPDHSQEAMGEARIN